MQVKEKPVFSKAEVCRAQKELIQERYSILPIEVNQNGYYYEGFELLNAIKNEKTITRNK